MADLLICSSGDLAPELVSTVLWRQELQRHFARTLEEARAALAATKPTLVLVERDLAGATHIVKATRQAATTRRCPLAVLARGDFEPEPRVTLTAPSPSAQARVVRDALARVPLDRAVVSGLVRTVELGSIEELSPPNRRPRPPPTSRLRRRA